MKYFFRRVKVKEEVKKEYPLRPIEKFKEFSQYCNQELNKKLDEFDKVMQEIKMSVNKLEELKKEILSKNGNNA